MSIKSVLTLLETPYTRAMHYFKVWCDDHKDRTKYNVTSKEALFEYGKENKIPKKVAIEIADDMRIKVANWDGYDWK